METIMLTIVLYCGNISENRLWRQTELRNKCVKEMVLCVNTTSGEPATKLANCVSRASGSVSK